jgi:hypothetical protein
MVDRNVTLAVPWTQITSGIARYADDPAAAGTGLGVGYFPPVSADTQAPGSPTVCDPGTYSQPETLVGLLPGNAAEVKRTIPPPIAVLAGSPTKAALEGALGHAASRWNSFDFAQAVVLITDEVQDFTCFVEPRELEDVAATARALPAAVPTYVLALTVPEIQGFLQLIGVAQLDNLDAVARSGGTNAAHEVSLNLVSGISATVADELLSIQRDAEPCRFEVPLGLRAPASADDLDATVLGTAVGNAAATALRRVGNAAECGQGYYLDDLDAPKWATMCPATCSAAKVERRDVLWLAECAQTAQ